MLKDSLEWIRQDVRKIVLSYFGPVIIIGKHIVDYVEGASRAEEPESARGRASLPDGNSETLRDPPSRASHQVQIVTLEDVRKRGRLPQAQANAKRDGNQPRKSFGEARKGADEAYADEAKSQIVITRHREEGKLTDAHAQRGVRRPRLTLPDQIDPAKHAL
jgi:hypothetical protein